MKLPSFSITKPADRRYIPVADGLRTLCIFGIMWYHIWQQSWLQPSITVLGKELDFNWLVRCGYLLVDGMLMLSGFLLFLPYANAESDNQTKPDILTFYKKRAVRILPSYYLSVFVMLFFVALPNGQYYSKDVFLIDFLSHLSLTHVFFPEAYSFTNLNVVLWTVSVEVQFYILFPFIARTFRKFPFITYSAMVLAAFCYRDLFAAKQADTTHLINQLPAMLDVYANGMLASYAYAALSRSIRENKAFSLLSTILTVFAIVCIYHIFNDQMRESGYEALRLGQMSRRFLLSFMFSVFLLFAAFSLRPLQFLLGNRVMRFFSAISYQAYIWHSVIALQLKKWRIPAYTAAENPQMYNEFVWQRQYTLLCFIAAILIGALLTYGFEKPVAKLLLRRKKHQLM